MSSAAGFAGWGACGFGGGFAAGAGAALADGAALVGGATLAVGAELGDPALAVTVALEDGAGSISIGSRDGSLGFVRAGGEGFALAVTGAGLLGLVKYPYPTMASTTTPTARTA